MPDLENSLLEINKLKADEENKLSPSSVVEISFNTSLLEVKKLYEGLIKNHSAGEKTPNQMYSDALLTIEQISSVLFKVREEMHRHIESTYQKVEVYNKCIDVLKKTNQKSQEEENLQKT